ncbi:MAG: SGNH/GDSL hydrolase family protein [Deltaproteobacteria bacterium]|nr:SGNH/GDSL hydrolase family protein [Deltaproteobacteria bacterium]
MQSLKVLFIGNSYTYYNDLPGMISQLAASSDEFQQLDTRMIAVGYKTLEWHYGNPETLDAIKQADRDIVVLQEHSMRPVEDRDKMFDYASKLDGEIKSSGARTVLYLTWARKHIPEMQEGLTDAYLTLAGKLGATVAPVGMAWQKALRTNPDFKLHKRDKSHPDLLGSYLAACVFYATFFRSSPVGLTGTIVDGSNEILTLQEKKAGLLQSIAWETVKDLGNP